MLHEPTGPVLSGRQAIVEHVQRGDVQHMRTVTLSYDDGREDFSGVILPHGDSVYVIGAHGEEREVYDTRNNNLTPHGLAAVTYGPHPPLSASQEDYALGALGPFGRDEDRRAFVAAMDAFGDDEAGGEMAYDEWRHRFEQRDMAAAADLLAERVAARQRLLDDDEGPDAMPDPDTDEMYLKADELRQTVEDGAEDTYGMDSDAARDETVRYARAVLATPRHGIVNPGFEYVVDSRDDVKAAEGIAPNGARMLIAHVDYAGGATANFNEPHYTTGPQDSAATATVKTGRTEHQEGDRYADFGRTAHSVRSVGLELRRDIKSAVAVGYLPSNLTYEVTSRGKLGIDASIDIRVTGLSEADRFAPTEKTPYGDPAERPGAAQLRERLEDIRGRYGSTAVNYDTDYFRASYWGGVTYE